MTDLLLRRVSKSRAGADGPEDYDVAGPDGLVVGRIFKHVARRNTLDVDGELRLPRGPHPDARLQADARGGHGGIRQELAARITRLQRANHLLGAAIAGRSCNITDATPKVIAVAKVRANIVIHICSSIAWQAGAQPVSQPPAPGLSSSRWTGPQPMIRAACA